MKKRITLLFALITVSAAVSQTNLGFENWATSNTTPSYEDPVDWQTSNLLSVQGIPITVEKSTDAQSGLYSCKLTTKNYEYPGGSSPMEGMILLGAQGQIPYTSRPDSLIFWYKYIQQDEDSAGVILRMLKNGQDVASEEDNNIILGPQANWKRHGMKITYSNQNAPDTIGVGFVSSASEPVVGSVLFIDAVSFKMPGTVGIEEVSLSRRLLVYPNPAAQNVTVCWESGSPLEISDMLGRKLATFIVEPNGKVDISVRDFTDGVYLLKTTGGAVQHFIVKH